MEIKEIKENEYKINMTEEEKEKLMKICKTKNITIEDFINSIFNWIVDNPKEAFDFIKEFREDKCPTGIIGKPFFDYGDEVGFYITPYKSDTEIFCKGKVYIIDAYGTFEQNEEPSYDIMVENFNNSGERCLVKHIRESSCYKIS